MKLQRVASFNADPGMLRTKIDDVITLLDRIFRNRMEYDLAKKPGTAAYYLLKERLTGTTVCVITEDKLLSERFWNNWHGVY